MLMLHMQLSIDRSPLPYNNIYIVSDVVRGINAQGMELLRVLKKLVLGMLRQLRLQDNNHGTN